GIAGLRWQFAPAERAEPPTGSIPRQHRLGLLDQVAIPLAADVDQHVLEDPTAEREGCLVVVRHWRIFGPADGQTAAGEPEVAGLGADAGRADVLPVEVEHRLADGARAFLAIGPEPHAQAL